MNDRQDALAPLEHHLGRLLIAGISVSAVLLFAGLALFLFDPASSLSAALMTMGIFTLMATPMLRVVVSIAEYARIGDWFFVGTTVLVLGVLALSVVLAFTGR